ncbi:carbonic anhydrase family protein [Marivivens donghaensis]|uniref:carbonic anhydrase n=1 Tax=Marivivens donghaensis TaxID=1699413 RepID=A0ABX0VT95_9RHOB|nr:carbonic anhydrase family protein [Marivivens donghaensis]NIY71212.1 carbonic anhydrase family protein [Marivivens donghaensis]
MKLHAICSLLASAALASAAVAQDHSSNSSSSASHSRLSTLHWSYPNSGNENWGILSDTFAVCDNGAEQSPIDLTGGINADLPQPQLSWDTSADLTVVDNGHTIQVNVANGGGMTIGGKYFELLQFHFHAPSEHAINGTRAPMEVHYVHKAADGQLAVIGVLMIGGGTNALFNTIMTGASVEASSGFELVGHYDLTDLLPENTSVYRYQGSLTTPPCSETVLWTVMQQPVAVSDESVAAFTKRYAMNARSLQPVNRRFVLTN